MCFFQVKHEIKIFVIYLKFLKIATKAKFEFVIHTLLLEIGIQLG